MQPSESADGDRVRRFIFENRPVRGHWVRLGGAWGALRAHAHYDAAITGLLGEAVVASVLLAATLKFRGMLTLQLQGDGALGLLVAQCTHDFRVRAVARCDEAAVRRLCGEGRRGLFRRLVGAEGRTTVTVEAEEASMRYQGVVPLTGRSLSESLEAYFASSEQLPTRVLLAADDSCAAGMLVQKLPGDADVEPAATEDAWVLAQEGIARVTPARILAGGVEELLERAFPGQDLRLFRGTPVRFECRCSQGRVAALLRALGADEVRDVLREQGSVTVTCEFCHRPYRFDPVDVEALFSGEALPTGGSAAIH